MSKAKNRERPREGVARDGTNAWVGVLWFCSLAGLLLSQGPAVLVSLLTTTDVALDAARAMPATRPFEVAMRSDAIETACRERAILWVSACCGAALYMAAWWACVCVARRPNLGLRIQAVIFGLFLLVLLYHGAASVGKQAILSQEF